MPVTSAIAAAVTSTTTAAAAALTTFLAVFPAELPDKTMMAVLVLTTRFRQPLAVWCGAATAFLVHVVVAVAFGRLLSELPERPVNAAVALLFAVGAVVLWRSAEEDTDEEEEDPGEAHGFGGIALRSFAVILVAELGDLTQLTTAGMAARTAQPVAVAIGALAALWMVAGIGAVAGEALLRWLPVRLVRRVAACIFALLALWTALEAVR
jgi:putative Ca2+/H+ antiporter (TMEM165/GDT1 family)